MIEKKRTLERLTVLCHGDVRFAHELRRQPKLALASAGVWTNDRRAGLALCLTAAGPEVVASLEEYETDDHEYEFNGHVAQAITRVKEALAHGRGTEWDRNNGPLNIILIGPDPIPDCVETLVKPPGETGFGSWTMCAARSMRDRRLAWAGSTKEAALLPGAEIRDRGFLMQIRHGSRLIEIAGAATREAMRAVSEGRAIALDSVERRCAMARLTSRGLVVAQGPRHPSTLRHALIGVSPTRAQEIRERARIGVVYTGKGEGRAAAVLEQALTPYGMEATAPAHDADIVVVWRTDDRNTQDTERLARALHAQRRAWWLVAPGPAGAIVVHGKGDAPCLRCAAEAVEEGPWHFNARGPEKAMRWTQSATSALGRELVRAAAEIAATGTTRVIEIDEDGEMPGDQLEADPQCPVCGRPALAPERRRKGRLKRALGDAQSDRPWSEGEETEVLRWAERAKGQAFGAIESITRRAIEYDPYGRVLHHVVARARERKRCPEREHHGGGTTYRDAMLDAIWKMIASEAQQKVCKEQECDEHSIALGSKGRQRGQAQAPETNVGTGRTLREAACESLERWIAAQGGTAPTKSRGKKTVTLGAETDDWSAQAVEVLRKNTTEIVGEFQKIAEAGGIAIVQSKSREGGRRQSAAWGQSEGDAMKAALAAHAQLTGEGAAGTPQAIGHGERGAGGEPRPRLDAALEGARACGATQVTFRDISREGTPLKVVSAEVTVEE